MNTSKTAVQSIINEYWDGRASNYDRNQQREGRRESDEAAWTRVAASALPKWPARILDAGTGSGFFAFVLVNLGYEVIGCDLSEKMIQIAQTAAVTRTHEGRKRPRFIVDDAQKPNIEPGSVDAITARYLMWTLPEPLEALLNWKRLLTPGGTLALIDAPWFPAGLQANKTPGFAKAYTAEVAAALPLAEAQTIEETVAMVRQAGFHQVEVTALNEIYDLDRIDGAAPHHHVQLQYLITAKSPHQIESQHDSHLVTAQSAIDALRQNLEPWSDIFSLASDPTRLQILVALHAAPEATVTELANAVQRSPNTVTQALQRLEKAAVAKSRPDGRYRRWRLVNKRIHDLLHHISAPHSDLHPPH